MVHSSTCPLPSPFSSLPSPLSPRYLSPLSPLPSSPTLTHKYNCTTPHHHAHHHSCFVYRPLCLTYEYYPTEAILDIFLLNSQYITDTIETTEDIDDEDNWSILATKDKCGRLIALAIGDASKVLSYVKHVVF